MKRAKKLSLVIAIVMILQLAMPMNFVSGNTGTDVTDRIKSSETEVDINIYNGGNLMSPGTDGSYKDVPLDAEIEMSYEFSFNSFDESDKEYYYYDGDFFTINFPKPIKFDIPVGGLPLKKGNEVVGILTINGSIAKVTFTKYVETESEIKVKFQIKGTFTEDIIKDENPVTIDLLYEGKTIKIGFKETEPESIDLEVEKDGKINLEDSSITWKIKVTPKDGKTANGVVLKDVFSDNQEFIDGTFKVNGVVTSSITKTAIGFEYAFPGPITGTQTIEYKTQIKDTSFSSENGTSKEVIYKNKVEAFQNGDKKGESNKSISLDWIKKNGNLADDGKKIKWTVEIDSQNGYFNGKNAVIKDTLDSTLKLVEGNSNFPIQIKFDNGTATTVSEDIDAGNGYYSYTGDNLEYHFNNSATFNKAVLTYYTDIDNPLANHNNNITYNNKAEIIWSGNITGPSDTVGVGIGKGIIQKSAESTFDYWDKKEINWTVYINKNRVSITGAKLEDTIPVGLTYKEGSFKLNGTVVPPSISGNTISYTIGNIDSPQTITYTTTINNNYKELFLNGNVTFTNNVNLTGTGIKDGNATDEATQTVGSQIINKSVVKDGGQDYNYNTRIVKWQIVVNKNGIPLNNVSVTDAIPLGMKFLPETFKVDGIQTALTSDQYIVNDAKDIQNKDSFTYILGNITKQYKITFETEVKEEYLLQNDNLNKLLNFENEAGITTSSFTGNPKVTAEVNVKNYIVQKTGERTGLDLVKWSVPINTNKVSLSNVTLTDELQKGLALDVKSVELFEATINNKGELTKGSKVINTGKYSFTYDETTRIFTFNFLETIQEAYVLEFATDVLADKIDIKNTISFVGSDKSISSNVGEVNVNINDWDGSAETTNGKLIIVKINESGEALSGAEYKVYDKIKTHVKYTVNDNETEYTSLPYRWYNIEETKAPDGYLIDKTVKRVKVDSAEGARIEIINKKAVANIELIKHDEKGLSLSGAEFTLYKDGNVVGTPVTSDSNGKIIFKGVEPGKYTIKETKAPTGYKALGTVINAEVKVSTDQTKVEVTFNGGVASEEPLVIKNELVDVYGDILINKTDNSGKLLAGAEFKLYDKDNNVIQTVESDLNGEVKFNNIGLGTYTIKETKAPGGYYKSSDVITAVVTRNENLVDADVKLNGVLTNKATVKNASIDVTIKKTDENDRVLEGAEFTLYDENNNAVQTAKSNALGEVVFKAVPIGRYTIKEAKAPSGYYKTETVVAVEVKVNDTVAGAEVILSIDGQATNEVVVTNKRIPSSPNVPELGKIAIKKTDENKNVLAGAEFTLYNDKGVVVEKAVTGDDGIVTFKEIAKGSYTIKETKAPTGYVLSEKVTDVKINGSNTETFTFVNKKEEVLNNSGNIEIIKTNESGKMLSDAEFKLYDKNGAYIKSAVSDKNGRVLFENIPLGKYTIIESHAPEGYELSTERIVVNVDKSETVSISFTNKVINQNIVTGKILINKIDENSKPLAGAEFTLYNENGVAIQSVISDKNGKVLFDNLPLGKYSVQETMAPEGYEVVSDVMVIKVNEGKTLTYSFRNIPLDSTIEDSDIPKGWTPIDDTDVPKSPGGVLPNTGSILDTLLLIVIGSLLIITGLVLIRRKRVRG